MLSSECSEDWNDGGRRVWCGEEEREGEGEEGRRASRGSGLLELLKQIEQSLLFESVSMDLKISNPLHINGIF
jgi:hypothetical protein